MNSDALIINKRNLLNYFLIKNKSSSFLGAIKVTVKAVLKELLILVIKVRVSIGELNLTLGTLKGTEYLRVVFKRSGV
jgi:hypothetical protein